MKKKEKEKGKSTRKRGGQQGNKNALKHGFYSKSYKPDEAKRLDDSDPMDLYSEISLLRVMADRLQAEISFDPRTLSDSNGNTIQDDHYLRQLNTLSAMTTSLATLVRTQYLTRGKGGDLQSSILTALEELRLEMGL